MKKKALCLLLCLAMLLGLLAACTPEAHVCSAPCEICGKCKNAACAECKEKCPGHTEPTGPSVTDKVVTETKLVTYDGPGALESSKAVGVSVEEKPLFVYDTRVNHGRTFTYVAPDTMNQVVIFDFEGRVTLEVEVKDAASLSGVVVRPLAAGVKPQVDGNKIRFTLEYPTNYVLEYAKAEGEDPADNALHIFANPIEEDPVTADNVPADTLYIGPGVWMANALPVMGDNATIYLAGGAVVYGQIRTSGSKNLTIRGRGILCGSVYDREKASEFTLPIELQNCDGVKIEDIAILDPAGWAVTLYKCKNVQINNLKIITARANGDGISVQSCENVTVSGGFVRSWDDSLVVKNVDEASTSQIAFNGVTVWTDLAQSMEVGFETYGPSMNGISFKNITVLHNYHKAAMSIHNADNAVIRNVSYENITIEDAQMKGDNQLDGENDFLIDMTIAFNTEWTQSGGERGAVKDITFRNIKVIEMAESIICRMFGEGVSSNIDNVQIIGVEIGGKAIGSLAELKLEPGAYTSNVSFTKDLVSGAAVTIPYTNQIPAGAAAQVTANPNISQTGLEVPEFAILLNDPTYAGHAIPGSDITVQVSRGEGDRANDPWNLEDKPLSEAVRNAAAMLTDGQRSTEFSFDGWEGLEDESLVLSFQFREAKKIGNIRILGSESSNIYSQYAIAVFAQKEAGGKWVRINSIQDISLNPQDSNYADLKNKIDKNGYFGIQLRIFKRDGIKYPDKITIGEIEFYPPSMTTNKTFTEVAEHEDVYDIDKMLDGNTLTYFESKKGVFPAVFAVDMGEVVDAKYINIHLPPLLLWESRTQEIEILGSIDGKTYEVVVAKATYTFDPVTGNVAALVLETPVQMRYIKFIFTSNSTEYGAQISELYVYGE